jgi:hypothetical protein
MAAMLRTQKGREVTKKENRRGWDWSVLGQLFVLILSVLMRPIPVSVFDALGYIFIILH